MLIPLKDILSIIIIYVKVGNIINKHVINDPRYFDKTISNMQEVIARGGKVLMITDDTSETMSENIRFKFQLPKTSESANPFLLSIPIQFLAYHVALLKNCDIDKPRNLAKSVTVE